MKVSIITVSYNAEQTIEETLQSVTNQTYDNIEYIIIDGASKDSTISIVNKYMHKIHKVVSEKDNSIYDAFNKGLKLATGDVVGLLNSDDIYAHENVISNVVNCFKQNDVDAVYGDLKYVAADDNSKTIRYWKSGKYNRRKFIYGWMPPHPTFFVKRAAYDKLGDFDTSLKSAADYELMLRFLYKEGLTAAYNNEVMVLMKAGGQSNASLKNRLLGNKEDKKAWIKNELKTYFFTTFMKPLRKIPQFFIA